jgi:ribosomal protein S18 acetylase RimI-like enzyme
MNPVAIRRATGEDAPAIADMLQQLAEHVGDGAVFKSDTETIRQYGFGAEPLFFCAIAERDKTPRGLALYFPYFSTTRGRPGVYVQDLWVDPATRGTRTGRRLLAAVADHGRQGWGADYLVLTVHRDNRQAFDFYHRLGFSRRTDDVAMALDGKAFRDLLTSAEMR